MQSTIWSIYTACKRRFQGGISFICRFLFPDPFKRLSGITSLLFCNDGKALVTLQNLEEFLIGIGKKERVALKIESENLEVYEVMASLKDTLRIHRSTWGHLKAEIFVEGDFLEVEKKKISDDDFIGSVYEMEYIIRRENLGKGKNFGRIRIRTVYEELVYMVVASKSGERQLDLETYAKHKKSRTASELSGFLTWKDRISDLEGTDGIRIFRSTRRMDFSLTEYKLVQIYLLHCLNEKEQAGKLLGQLKSEKEVVKNKRLSLESVNIWNMCWMTIKKHLKLQQRKCSFWKNSTMRAAGVHFYIFRHAVLPKKMGHCFADLVDLQDRLCCLQNVMESFQKRWHFVQQIYRKTFESIRNLSMNCWNIFIRDTRPPRLCVQSAF